MLPDPAGVIRPLECQTAEEKEVYLILMKCQVFGHPVVGLSFSSWILKQQTVGPVSSSGCFSVNLEDGWICVGAKTDEYISLKPQPFCF